MTALTAVTVTELLAPRPGWQRWAACRGADPELFFPTQGEPTAPAKAVCGTCLVRLDCLEYALGIREKTGIWGGKSERERRLIRRERDRGHPKRTPMRPYDRG
ncbi:MAG: WhiB family transcriptional regulator [Acidimicrobiales bacterium]|jgi:WhiB family redox-sensing transcriptional regulator